MTPDTAALEVTIAVLELETAMNRKNPVPHFRLASLYQQLPTELSPEVRRIIEEEKLRIEGRAGILDMPRDSQTIIAGWGPNPTWEQRLSAAEDYINSANSLGYLGQDNVQRAVMNLSHGLYKARDDKPGYRDLLNTLFVNFLLDKRFHPHLSDIAHEIRHS